MALNRLQEILTEQREGVDAINDSDADLNAFFVEKND